MAQGSFPVNYLVSVKCNFLNFIDHQSGHRLSQCIILMFCWAPRLHLAPVIHTCVNQDPLYHNTPSEDRCWISTDDMTHTIPKAWCTHIIVLLYLCLWRCIPFLTKTPSPLLESVPSISRVSVDFPFEGRFSMLLQKGLKINCSNISYKNMWRTEKKTYSWYVP